MNQFGRILRLTTYGESHGKVIGGVIDGFPPGFEMDLASVQAFVNKRRPGQNELVTPRSEADSIEFLSGLLPDGKTTGAPIGFFVRNSDVQSDAYQSHSETFRPSHADFTYFIKYGITPQPGGGRASARETVARCVAGAMAKQWLQAKGVTIYSFLSELADLKLEESSLTEETLASTYSYPSYCPSEDMDLAIGKAIGLAKQRGDSLGGIVSVLVKGLPAGVGEPIYDKLSARLAYAMLSINAAKGFEIGDGFAITKLRGSQANDPITLNAEGQVAFESNHTGGILGGISTGQDIRFRVAFKPTPTISQPQKSITIDNHPTTITAKGRHDPALVIRAVPVVDAMTALVLMDQMLQLRMPLPR